ncbi:hypothetical protein [Desulforhabdus sp. TSK]|uniref:hypothetical protein n=1 Tax=Desulforhabdus sp. TSK TaxID=2925014 RepID=UPI001FC8CC23|nr:hypothetical protein [Desulforhabdus sp. TSK]GKT09122.1 hypothetical protein DSTSK_24270 [Desulforhabdus sp. TSK]
MSESNDLQMTDKKLNDALQNDSALFLLMRQEAISDPYEKVTKIVEEGRHPSHEMLYDYVLEWLDEKTFGMLLEHISICGSCAGEVLRIRTLEEDAENNLPGWDHPTELPDEDHLSDRVLKSFLRAIFTERNLLHLRSCESCQKRLRELEGATRFSLDRMESVDFSQLMLRFSGKLNKLKDAFESTLQIFRFMPLRTVASASTGKQDTSWITALVKDSDGNTTETVSLEMCNPPRIERGVFTTEIETTDKRFFGCEMTVGISLRSAGILLTVRDVIPSDGRVYIRELTGFEGTFDLHPHMLIVTILCTANRG